MIDLHLHLDGSIHPEDMFRLAEMSGAALPAEREEEIRKMLMVEPGCRNLGEYLEKFALPLQVLQTKESMEYAVYRLLKRLRTQGLCYAEIRFAPQLHTQKGLTQEAAVHAAVSGLGQGIREFGISAGLILCCMRGAGNGAENTETVAAAERFLGKGVCAVDLAGNEAAYPTEMFSDVFGRAQERHVPVVIHAGEAAGAESVRKALESGALRIGHGIRAMEDSGLMELLRDRKIYLEMCYSSNLQTRAVDSPEDYPLPEFMEKGLYVTVSTDNMTVSDTNLKKEYLLLKKQFALTDDALKQLALNAAEGAFVTEEERAELKSRIQREFAAWLGQG
ncbi:adenosine deaminase [Acetatifactor aquisgranensis]|uniref:adenosine deaminase n=1 Tax=Acetatifactor aquisgranensis TaxID=2941233 RepID=UPI00203EFF2A|nr:adenosine deaminase [Acetatifactor aquisgranensis]